MTAPARLCIGSPNRNAYSETFIAAHIERLPGVALVLTDGHLPRRDAEGALLLPPSLARRVASRLMRITPEALLERRITRLLKRHRIEVVLAEYGPTGEALLEPCRRAGVPLVVHFHGVDAFHVKLLKDHAGYRRILEHIYAPGPYYQRVRTFLKQHRPTGPTLGRSSADVRAFLKSLWLLGARHRGRWAYWRLFAGTLLKRPRQFPRAIELAIVGFHFRSIADAL